MIVSFPSCKANYIMGVKFAQAELTQIKNVYRAFENSLSKTGSKYAIDQIKNMKKINIVDATSCFNRMQELGMIQYYV